MADGKFLQPPAECFFKAPNLLQTVSSGAFTDKPSGTSGWLVTFSPDRLFKEALRRNNPTIELSDASHWAFCCH